MSVRHRRRGVHAETVAPWIALSCILLMWWMGAQLLHWYRPAFRSTVTPASPAAERKAAPPPATTAPARATTPATGASEPSSATANVDPAGDLRDLRARTLAIPVDGIAAAALVPSFEDARGGRKHEALDILAPRGTRVIAVEDGTIAKLFTSDAGGLTVYQFDPSERFVYYYAHLDAYAPGLTEGAPVKRGAVVGFVGTTGNAPKDTPHLHFGIARLDVHRQWWGGTPLDPFLVWRDSAN